MGFIRPLWIGVAFIGGEYFWCTLPVTLIPGLFAGIALVFAGAAFGLLFVFCVDAPGDTQIEFGSLPQASNITFVLWDHYSASPLGVELVAAFIFRFS